jgi:hypothetical protein
LFFLLCLLSLHPLHAQFLNSIGITAGVTYGNERWVDKSHQINESKKYILGYNGSVFAEFFSDDYLRWVSEFQFDQKGSDDKVNTENYNTRLNYICFNNYLKIRDELLNIIPYVLLGPKLEYKFYGSSSSPLVIGNFNLLHVSFAMGAGMELVAYGPVKFFVEGFYNPDLMRAYNDNGFDIRNNAFELRVGLKYEFSKKSKGMDCHSPTYIAN